MDNYSYMYIIVEVLQILATPITPHLPVSSMMI
jgi:hypothetical protein